MIRNKEKIIYPELSYKIVGCLFGVYNIIGSNHREKFYQNALSHEFRSKGIQFKEQLPIELKYKGFKIGKDYLDFLIEDKIVLELKSGSFFSKKHLEQILEYLKVSGLKLGIIVNFGREGVRFHRVLNSK